MSQPSSASGNACAQRGHGGKAVNDVAHGAEAHDQHPGDCGPCHRKLRHILRRVSAGEGVLTNASAPGGSESSRWWNGLWDRPQFPLVRHRRSLRRAREQSRRCSPCPWHAHRGGFADDRAHVGFRKNHHRINIGQRSQNFGAFLGRHQGAAFAFQGAHGRVRIDGHDQSSAQIALAACR